MMTGNNADIFISRRSSFGVSAPSRSLSLYWSLLSGAAISSLTLSLKGFLQQLLLCMEKDILQSRELQHKGRATEHVQQHVPLPLKGHIRPRETSWKAEQLQLILKSFVVGWNWVNAFVSPFQWGLDFWTVPFKYSSCICLFTSCILWNKCLCDVSYKCCVARKCSCGDRNSYYRENLCSKYIFVKTINVQAYKPCFTGYNYENYYWRSLEQEKR